MLNVDEHVCIFRYTLVMPAALIKQLRATVQWLCVKETTFWVYKHVMVR